MTTERQKITIYSTIRNLNLIIVLLMTFIVSSLAEKTIDVTEFKTAGYEKDATPMVVAAINYCKKNAIAKLTFHAVKNIFLSAITMRDLNA